MNIALKLFLVLAAILLLTPQVYQIERFAAAPTAMPSVAEKIVPTSIDLFKITKSYAEFDRQMKERRNTIGDRDELMTFSRCYQMPMGTNIARNLENMNYATVSFKLHTASFAEVQTRIIQEVLKFKDRLATQKIEGDVMVYISQVPYFIDDQGRTMTVQYHINQYVFKPYNITNPESMDEPLDISVVLAFTKYDKRGGLVKNARKDLVTLMRPLESRDQKCKIECTHENNVFCGCANKGRRGGAPKNTAICLGPDSKKPQQEIRADFVIGYKINKIFDPFVVAGAFI